jgi:methylated-DNA-[protein]-cysteine S-methyltransferase
MTLYTTVDSPVGELLLAGDGTRLSRLAFTGAGVRRPLAIPSDWTRRDDAFDSVRTQLDEYFAGARRSFHLKLDLTGGSEWEQRVWTALRAIPYGETVSYGELAAELCSVRAARAVGLSNSRNRVAVIVPCHRVIGGDGRLTGFRGGLDRKRALLDLEAGRLALTG